MAVNPKVEFLAKLAKTLIDRAAQQNIVLRALGGVAVHDHCRGVGSVILAEREYRSYDLDLIAMPGQIATVTKFMVDCGLKRPKLSKYGGGLLGEYQREEADRVRCSVDVYFGRLRFNHEIPAPYFAKAEQYTIPVTQLLLSKLAIDPLNDKDKIDIISLLCEHEFGDEPDREILQRSTLRAVWSHGWDAWGNARTCFLNAAAVRTYLENQPNIREDLSVKVLQQIEELESLISRQPKSLFWRIRGLFGAKVAHFNIVQPSEP